MSNPQGSRKRFGQHFLQDLGVVEQIVRAIRPQPNDNMIEIGPGSGALTQPLLQQLKHLTVVEIDRDLVAQLRAQYSPDVLTILSHDVLKVDFVPLGAALRIVANLPYNISTPLLFHLAVIADRVVDQHFMMQKEVVDRMTAPCGSPQYSRLSVMLQYRYYMESLFDVTPDAFTPPPQVMSSVVRMIPLPAQRPRAQCDAAFAALVTRCFGQRRKMLRKSLQDWRTAIDWEALELSETARPQDVSVAQYIGLADQLLEKGLLQPKNQ